jgi:hypothetical protein
LQQQLQIANKESDVYKQRAKEADEDKRKAIDTLNTLKAK